MSTTCPLAYLSQVLQKLEHCSGENAEKLHNHLKQPKLKIKDLGIDPNSCEGVTVILSSFTGHLGNWAASHADKIIKLDNIGALAAYFRVSVLNEYFEGMNR